MHRPYLPSYILSSINTWLVLADHHLTPLLVSLGICAWPYPVFMLYLPYQQHHFLTCSASSTVSGRYSGFFMTLNSDGLGTQLNQLTSCLSALHAWRLLHLTATNQRLICLLYIDACFLLSHLSILLLLLVLKYHYLKVLLI